MPDRRALFVEELSDADLEAILAEIEGLMNAEPDTPEGDRLDVLTTLVEAWEEKHHGIN